MSNTITARTVAHVSLNDSAEQATIIPVVLTQDQIVSRSNLLTGTFDETHAAAGQWFADLAVTFASTATAGARTRLVAAMPKVLADGILGGKGEAIGYQVATVGTYLLRNKGDETITLDALQAARKAIKDATGGKGGTAMSRAECARIVRESASLADIPASIAAEMKLRKADSLGENDQEAVAVIEDDHKATPQELINNVNSILNAEVLRDFDDVLELDVTAQLFMKIINRNKALKAAIKAEVAA